VHSLVCSKLSNKQINTYLWLCPAVFYKSYRAIC